ncbi:thioesterase family protein [Nostocoides sp.]|jgi:acyl-CoA thioesterase|uniref:thioesterase family protein n=1 Tax=Nostocoides sp. TaxID=1917966 RepID=UPI003BB15630
MPASHPIDVLFDAAAAGAAVEIPQGWGQGRAIFGGVVAGVLQARSLAAYELDPATLRATTTSFVAPASPGPARVESILLRQGSSATQTETRLWQRDERTGEETIRGVQLSAYGLPRASAVDLPAARPAQAPPDPDRLVALPCLPGFTPDFFAHVDLRVASGSVPFTGSPTGDLSGYMRFRDAPRRVDLPHFIALVDAWPPAVGQCLRVPAAMSTQTWTLELLAEPTGPADQHWLYEVVTDAAHDGYAHSHARVFTATGDPVAISRQSIAIFG